MEKCNRYIVLFKKLGKSFVFFVLLVMLCRLATSETLYYAGDLGYVATFAILFALISALWKFKTSHTILCLSFIFFYFMAAILKRYVGMILPEREITHTMGFALLLFSGVSLILYSAQNIKIGWLRKTMTGLACVLDIVFLLPPLMVLGYALVNKSLFSSDIMLTLFQTNPEEIVAYLSDKNPWLWAIGFLCIGLIVGKHAGQTLKLHTARKFGTLSLLAGAWFIYVLTAISYKLNLCFLVNIGQTTYSTLQSFEDFRIERDKRMQNLQQLMNMNVVSSEKGIYVLVIGESTTKDHMQIYGYTRKTTPWLEEFVRQKDTIVFQNAYANHVHTVPALTYALSAENQYNNIKLSEAYSLIEVAKAAGYKTYWLSNQPKYGVLDTPLTTMASFADVQEWLNVNTGDKIFASYYDEALVHKIPDDIQDDKVLIIVHLMGSHGSYRDRYPMSFDRFSGTDRRVDPYDNSILYNDYVLQRIYEKVSSDKNFKAWVYFSDHGDDPDRGLGHESSRFTYRMVRIPMIVRISPQFAAQHLQEFENLKTNSTKPWTNDLIYDLMVRLMGIEQFSQIPSKLNILSSEYNLSPDDVLLMHGQKKLTTTAN